MQKLIYPYVGYIKNNIKMGKTCVFGPYTLITSSGLTEICMPPPEMQSSPHSTILNGMLIPPRYNFCTFSHFGTHFFSEAHKF